ncbi:MAG: cadmium-translocating P-type ATPase, partial [Bacteroidia bacterium]|nr:cadmium-translocating P-type ATPase [Bacteroidia bacterium]
MINTDPLHKHTYDKQGRITCCSLEEKINAKTDNQVESHSHDEHAHNHEHSNESEFSIREYLPSIISFVLLISGLAMDYFIKPEFFKSYVRIVWYVVAYIPVAFPVVKQAFKAIFAGAFFSEFFLMSIASAGAFAIGEYPEGVAVMLFYTIGELFQEAAVGKAKRSIKALLDVRPDKAIVIRNGEQFIISPKEIITGETILIKPGEKAALDGILTSTAASFNTAALTGESVPETKNTGDTVFAGMISLNAVAEIKVTALYKDSKLSRILEMVQNASASKSPTQLFITKFAKIYTPVVVFSAIAIALLPYFFVGNYVFADWLYRALVFLVISCPCALVISIPLGYFGGIGLASANGILFKGSNFLDVITTIDTVVMDKTGTLTEGVFEVQKVVAETIDKNTLVNLTAALESNSTHPVAAAIVKYAGDKIKDISAENVEEIAGHGLKGLVDGKEVFAGNLKLLNKFNITYDPALDNITETIVVVSVDKIYAGYIIISDRIKSDAKQTITELHSLGIKTIMLSGDKQTVVDKVSKELGIDEAFGGLLPEDKVAKVQELKSKGRRIAFAGDGFNDAPVIALADAGIAMGGL